MPPLLRRPVSAGARPGPGRSSLDSACAPAVRWQLSDKRNSMISQIEVSTLSGEPRMLCITMCETTLREVVDWLSCRGIMTRAIGIGEGSRP